MVRRDGSDALVGGYSVIPALRPGQCFPGMSGASLVRCTFAFRRALRRSRFRLSGRAPAGLQRGEVHHPGIRRLRRGGLGGGDRVQRGERRATSRRRCGHDRRGRRRRRDGRHDRPGCRRRRSRRNGRHDGRRRWGRGRGFRHHGGDRAVDKRRRRDRRLRRGGHRHAGRVLGIGGSHPEPAVIGGRLVCIVVERQIAEALARRRLPDVPRRVAGRTVPGHRARQPRVLCEARALDLRAHGARAVHPDPIGRPAAARRREPGVDAAEILVDLIESVAARVEIDREVDRAARRLADFPRLAIGGLRIGVAGSVGEVDRVGRMPFPDRDDLYPRRRQGARLARRQRRPARRRIAVVAGDEIEPGPAVQFAGDIARVGRHVDAVDAVDLRSRHRRQRGRLGSAAGQQQRRKQPRKPRQSQQPDSPAPAPRSAPHLPVPRKFFHRQLLPITWHAWVEFYALFETADAPLVKP